MTTATSQHFLLPAVVPTLALWIGSVLLFWSWIRLRGWTLRDSHGWRMALPSFVRAMLCFAALLVAAQALQRHLVFATSWPIWPVLLAGGIAAELVLVLYVFERSTVTIRQGRLLAVARTLLVMLVVFALCQPMHTFDISRKIDRYVALLFDESASMNLPDTGMGFGERVRLAEYLSVPGIRRPFRVEEIVEALSKARQETAAQMDGIQALGTLSVDSGKQSSEKLSTLLDSARKIRSSVVEHSAKILEPLSSGKIAVNDALKEKVNTILRLVNSEAVRLLDERIKLLEAAHESELKRNEKDAEKKAAPDYNPILDCGRRAIDAIQKIESDFMALGDEMDVAFYNSLPEKERAAVDELAKLNRADLALKTMTAPLPGENDGEKKETLIGRINDRYGVKAYAFDGKVSELDHRKFEESRRNRIHRFSFVHVYKHCSGTRKGHVRHSTRPARRHSAPFRR